MKRLSILLFSFLLIAGCKEEPKTEIDSLKADDITTSIYPENVTKVFDAHGGIDKWNEFSGLYYSIERPDFKETHVVNLKSRQSRIDYKHHVLGFDGEKVWLKNLDTTAYKSDPRFYYNLMFYFYAMPFVLGDDGINYKETDPLTHEGKEYPGILISYESGIGESPEDEYILYYDADTGKMEWLAYTVTFFTKEKAKKFKLIKYAEWDELNGVKLPKTLRWHQFEDGVVGDMQNEMKFSDFRLEQAAPNPKNFEIPEGAEVF